MVKKIFYKENFCKGKGRKNRVKISAGDNGKNKSDMDDISKYKKIRKNKTVNHIYILYKIFLNYLYRKQENVIIAIRLWVKDNIDVHFTC